MSKAKSTSKRPKKVSKKRIPEPVEQRPASKPLLSDAPSGTKPSKVPSQPREGQASQEVVANRPAEPEVRGSDPQKKDFIPHVLGKTVIALPLFKEFVEERKEVYNVIIDVNLMYHSGRQGARKEVVRLISEVLPDEKKDESTDPQQGINVTKTKFSQQYVFARLKEEVIKGLVKRDAELAGDKINPAAPGTVATTGAKESKRGRAIYHIWPDFKLKKLTTVSISTVKADAAHNAFAALGKNIVWAVMDSGIDRTHPHFVEHKNLDPLDASDPLQHRDFTAYNSIQSTDLDNLLDILKKNLLTVDPKERPLEDPFGHGTHVAGIIAGGMLATKRNKMTATIYQRDQDDQPVPDEQPIETDISGMAPKCKLISLKILDDQGRGETSSLIAAIEYIQEINGNGRHIRIHGVNMSVGYEYDPQWFACGQSPLCVEVNRLVKAGVVVVVAAGNTGYGTVFAKGKESAVTAGLDLTINDPGNADLAITVGSTHREMPHIYGVSYFSSKGPTGDGRLKPDLLAPGEKVISCHSSQSEGLPHNSKTVGYYKEDSGTSMAAPHVSGVIAAFLSVRREFIGQPEAVKEIFLSTATDLKRERYFQGHGLVDLMRAIQSV